MGNVEENFDLVIIGAGPGGYTGAIRAAQLGLKTAVIEKDATYGGTCLNVGCIPSKALLQSSEFYHEAQHDFSNHGIVIDSVKLDLAKMMARKNKIVGDLTNGIEFLFKKNKITGIKGTGKILNANTIEVTDKDGGKKQIQTKNIMIATGSVPVELPFLKFDEKTILSSTGALALDYIPKEMLVIGGGVIGLEMGSVWARLGSKVTVIEYSEQVCSMMDQDCITVLTRSLKKLGVNFITSAKVTASRSIGGRVELDYESLKDNSKSSIQGDVVLVSTGRKPFTDGLGLESVQVEKDERGRVKIDKNYRTATPNIYAVGDVTFGPMLAHKAEEEGVAVAEIIATGHGHVNYNTVPSVIYTHPEVASVGMTEADAKKAGIEVNVGKFPFAANGRAKARGATDGFVKIVADKRTDRIIGGHIVGAGASELLGEIVVAMEFGGSSEDLARSFHSHPTMTEVIREAALAVDKRQRQG
ncbi:dihydrolipoyl dehydrogenase [Pseudobdellovibrio exovorus]|uniref:Dihydrolipoyl dehydrogenase n=1 Tax=Pseudobdellovibrio exovorus JSS TaxID=1184267 RepID=M4VA10_9BACT|nr:dihydrolipoyl dehydrogenase [Pseudobdellovibrio exovorus]AGH96033.1 dihydrolipoamide dehydrogenase [Pseudobdellovibrio exovorus JSS]